MKHSAMSDGVVHAGPLCHTPKGASADCQTDTETRDAAVVLRDARTDHDVGGPACRSKKDEEQTEWLVIDFDARKHNHAESGEGESTRIAFGACGQCGNGDWADELDR
ncbi:MAG: hypothetical protein ACO31F_08885, partial [Ilumatobacteraceae bacterium]